MMVEQMTKEDDFDILAEPTVCLDFDGLLAKHTQWKGAEYLGPPNEEGAKLARMLHDDGVRLWVLTCRNNREMNKITGIDTLAMESQIVMWLVDNELSFCELWTGHGKPFAHAYVDDRGVYFPRNVGPAEIAYKAIKRLLPGGGI